ncbi:adenylate/guanylate cyclase domain-containing protein [Tumidithrix elongata RA019]|uniref:Adenylate/guanylate cyclase domain-containing protein n=1 Tax=Tumidithrix elongata BACA0141 TaxID=2716417 RepID=A0AAW9Q516_9CYAN|nr:adenylate/guanylate cyclase domain-containing protein [Tumidithrix elongata RA019]
MPYIIQNPETPTERVCELRFGTNSIGRGLENNIVVEDDARSLSRHHAEINLTDSGVYLTDLNSSNGTFVNSVKITQHKLQEGDSIQFGSVIFKFVMSRAKPPSNPQTSASANSGLSILMRVSPEKPRTPLRDLIKHDSALQRDTGSVLRLPEDDSQRTANKLKILLEVSQELASPQAFDVLPEKILNLLFEIMNVDRAVLLIFNEATQELEPKALKTKAGISADYEFYSKRITSFVHKYGDAILTDDACIDKRFDSAMSIIQQAIQAAMCVPLKPRDKCIGVLYVDNLSMSNVYHKEDLEFLTSLANQAAIAIENASLYKRMQTEVIRRARLERFFPQAVSQKIEEGGDLKIVETEVTALFSDISGFTEMSSQLEPRQVLEILNEYFKIMVEDIVFRYEGTLEKYIADALLAVWGSPYRRDDDAVQAVHAAIAMQWAMTHLNEQWLQQGRNLHIQIHIGLNTGKVAAGNIGSDKLIQYTNIGDTMNVASRICNAAKAGEVLISESTLAQISHLDIPTEKIEPVMVKGKDQPLQLYRVLWQQAEVALATNLTFHQ